MNQQPVNLNRKSILNSLLLLALTALLPACAGPKSWNLGACKPIGGGKYGCTVVIPKSAGLVRLNVQVEGRNFTPTNVLQVVLHNYNEKTVDMYGLAPEGSLQLFGPDIDKGFNAQPVDNGWTIAQFDSSARPIELGLWILGGKPKEGDVRIVAETRKR